MWSWEQPGVGGAAALESSCNTIECRLPSICVACGHIFISVVPVVYSFHSLIEHRNLAATVFRTSHLHALFLTVCRSSRHKCLWWSSQLAALVALGKSGPIRLPCVPVRGCSCCWWWWHWLHSCFKQVVPAWLRSPTLCVACPLPSSAHATSAAATGSGEMVVVATATSHRGQINGLWPSCRWQERQS